MIRLRIKPNCDHPTSYRALGIHFVSITNVANCVLLLPISNSIQFGPTQSRYYLLNVLVTGLNTCSEKAVAVHIALEGRGRALCGVEYLEYNELAVTLFSIILLFVSV